MGNRSINTREQKKKKKTDALAPVVSFSERPVMSQPEIVKKKKKEK